MEQGLVEVEAARPATNLLDYKPRDMVENAADMADVLKDIIDKQKLYTDFKGNKHVNAEGWATLGTMLNILPKEERVVEHEDGSFEAFVSLVSSRNGLIVGGGSGYVGMDEPNWKSKPKYARRSMAITRATSKAYRTCFSWIIALAGYKTCPAEEMDGIDVTPAPKPKKQKAKTKEIYEATHDQKKSLGDLFDEYKIDNKELKTKISKKFLEIKMPMHEPTLRQALEEIAANHDALDLMIEIPF